MEVFFNFFIVNIVFQSTPCSLILLASAAVFCYVHRVKKPIIFDVFPSYCCHIQSLFWRRGL